MDAKQASILIVDDEADIRESVADAFRKRGCATLLAPNGIEALALLAKSKVDAVVTDVRMPRLGGMELLQRVKAEPGVTPLVVLMSGYADVTLDEVYDLGAEALFAKPFSPRLLVETTLSNLTPRDEAWRGNSAPLTAVKRIAMSFASFDAARAQGQLNLGRGGIFLALGTTDSSTLRKDDPLTFRLEFDEGRLREIEGHGIVRWTRKTPGQELPPGCGIEISGLADGSLAPLVELITAKPVRSFIPKK